MFRKIALAYLILLFGSQVQIIQEVASSKVSLRIIVFGIEGILWLIALAFTIYSFAKDKPILVILILNILLVRLYIPCFDLEERRTTQNNVYLNLFS